MRSIRDGKRTMIVSATDMQDRARPFARALIEHQERRTGSRMATYEGVASWVGVSSSWLRKLIGRQPVDLGAHQFHNLASVYRSLCERIEAERDHERALAAALRGKADEAISSTLGMVERAPGSEAGGKGQVKS